MKIESQRAFLAVAAGLLFVCATAFILQGCGGNGATTVTTTNPPPGDLIPSLEPYPTPSGDVSTFSATGSIDPNGIFFSRSGRMHAAAPAATS